MSAAVAKVGEQVVQAVIKEVGKKAAKKAGQQAVKAVGKQVAVQAAESGLTSFMKAIPFVGLVINAGFAINEFSKGNVVNGLVDLAQGAVSMIPGAGLAVNLSVAAGGVAIKMINDHINKDQDEKAK